MSLYFEESAKKIYNGNQEDYARRSLRAVSKSARMMKDPLEGLFDRMIHYLGEKRYKVAHLHCTPEAEKFGLRRDVNQIGAISSLSERYHAYGERLSSQINEYLEEAKEVQHAWDLGPFRKTLPVSLGKHSFLDIVLINPEHRQTIFPTRTIQDFQHMYQLCQKELPQYLLQDSELYFKRHDAIEILFQDENAIETLFKTSPREYQKLLNTFNILSAQKRENISPLASWVLVDHYMEIDGRMIPISQFLLETSRVNGKESERICFHPTVIHQDPFFLTTSLVEMNLLFHQAIQWNQKTDSRDHLKQTVALLIYEWAHATPFLRGSAATGEWLERAIYHHHNFAYEYNPQKSTNLEALILPLKDFIDSYDSMITLFDLDDLAAELDWGDSFSETV